MNPNALKNLLATLWTSNVRFLVVGGVAVELAGYPRSTYDIDLLIDHDPENIGRFLEMLCHFGQGVGAELCAEDFDLTEGCVTINEEEIQIDVFTIMGGHTYSDLQPYAALHQGEVPVPFLNADGLILLKSRSVRPKDQMDVAALMKLKQNNS